MKTNPLQIIATAIIFAASVWGARGQSYEKSVASFGLNGDPGRNSLAPLLQGADGFLYGTTSGGESSTNGTVFKVKTDGSNYSVLHTFGNGTDGQYPNGGLVQAPDGALYGTTYLGGNNAKGTIFKIGTDGGGYVILHNFGAFTNDGARPFAGLAVGSDGVLYGTAYRGGDSSKGMVFSVNTDGNGYAVLHSFGGGIDGQLPYGGLVQGVDGALYGTTQYGGTAGFGTVFVVGTNGGGYAVLHSFNPVTDTGLNPRANLIQGSDRALYGTTPGGATAKGNVFRLNRDGSGFASLHDFGLRNDDGAGPVGALLQANDGDLYGTTPGGGANAAGTVFRVSADGQAYNVLYNFLAVPNDGVQPQAALIQGRNNTLYGTTYSGGDASAGTVFQLVAGPRLSRLVRNSNGTVKFSVIGFSNVTYRVEASTGLANWGFVGSVLGKPGGADFTDNAAVGLSQRFYRSVWTP